MEAGAPAGPAAASAGSTGQAGDPGRPSGRPPLPRSLPPSSANSSRASSPGRGGLSAQASLHTLSMNRVAQYRPASRTFRADAAARRGLNTGDVVAFRSQGKLLAITELGGDPAEAGAVHFGFQPSDTADPFDKLTHLEIIRQGKWLGFRSAAAGDRFLQARKRSPNRLVFFSQNVGTWEQWELAGSMPAAGGEASSSGAGAAGSPTPDPDACEWASLALKLRHRRLPQFELAVEVVRVGSVSLAGNGSATARSLLSGEPGSVGSAGSADDDPTLERRELKRMSGVLVHEWLHYVDQEKAARLAIEARVAQLAEDATGLRDWAVMQVDSVRSELGAEVQALLGTIERKSAKLADAEARLTGRLRWGVAMIQAKSEAAAKRRAFMWWRWLAARKRYGRHVEAKLQQRSALRLQARALQAWLEFKDQQQARQAQLRTAVRRMAYLKLYHAFAAWQDLVAYRRQQEADAAALDEAVQQHMLRWRLRRMLRFWQAHAAGCAAGRQALQRMVTAAERQAVAGAFTAWRTLVAQRRERLASLTALVASRQRQRAQQAAFQGWRLQVDDSYGARLQAQHAQQVLGRLRLRAVFRAWQEWQQQRADRRERWDATIAYMQQRRAAIRTDAVFVAWQQHVELQKEKRALLYEAVHHMALRRMAAAFRGWRYLTAYRTHARAVVEQSVVRLSQRALATAWQGWQQVVAERRVARHRIVVCQRRQQLALVRGAFAGWRETAALQGAERQLVQLCQRRADRNRMALALSAFSANAAAAAEKRERDRAAVSWYAERLQARAFAALAEAVLRRRELEVRLAAVAQSLQQTTVQEAFSGWRAQAALSTSESQLVAAARRRFARGRLQSCLAAWRSQVEQEQEQRRRLAGCMQRLSQMRLSWAFEVWRHQAAEAAAERRLVAWGQRRIARIRLAAAFAGWQQHTADLAAARQQAEQLGAAQDGALLQDCFVGWAAWAAGHAEQQMALMAMVERRAAWMQANVLRYWRALVQHKRQRQAQLQRAVRKLSLLRQQQAWRAWRAAVEEQQAEQARLALAERRLAARHSRRLLAAAFVAWRGHTATLAAARAAVDAKVTAEGAVVRRHALAAWWGATQVAAERRDHLLRVCVERRAALLQSKALFALQLHAQRRAHNREAVELMVHRMARRVLHAALLSWRAAAQERRVRRTAIVRFIQRWDAHRKAAALAHWRRLLAERREAEDNLKRCLIRKRVAFRLFRHWYWESFDDDMQETLRTMFEITEGAALDPLPSRAGSPYNSLLSSPIRQQLYGMPRQQQMQLSAGVAEAFMRSGAPGGSTGDLQQHYNLPVPPAREPLSARLAAAAAAGRSSVAEQAAPTNLGGTALAPLRDSFAAFSLHTNGLLETVPEAGESPYQRSPYAASPYSPYQQASPAQASGGKASSTASTAVPEQQSPLTPASGFAAGSTPLSGISRWTTPGGGLLHQPLSPSGLSAAATPGGLAWQVQQQQQQLGGSSPLGTALSDAPTPGYGIGSAARSLGGGPGSALRSSLSYAGTPQPDFGSLSPSAQLADAPTPGDLSLQGRYELRSFSDGTEYMAAAGTGAELGTPLAAQKTPPPGLLELQGDYSIRRISAAAEAEVQQLASEATPQPQSLIAAYPSARLPGSAAAAAGGGEGLSAAKTPVLHLNPLADYL